MKGLSDAEKQDLSAVTPATAKVRALDQQSLQQLAKPPDCRTRPSNSWPPPAARKHCCSSAATETLREEFLEVWSQGFDEIVGGTDRLPAAFVAKLRAKPKLGCEVITLDAIGGPASAPARIYREHGVEKRVDGDYLLCTLPCPVLSRIEVQPELSGPKWRAIRELNYDSSTKVLAVARRRFWETDDGIYGGGTYTDLPIASTWYPSDNAHAKNPKVSASPGVMLASYSWGQTARRLAALDHPARAAVVLRHLARVHPQLQERGMVRETRSWSWDNHPLRERRVRVVHARPAHRVARGPDRTGRTPILRRGARIA